MPIRVNRVEIGAAPDTVVIDILEATLGLEVDVEPVRAPKRRILGDGNELRIYGPGRDLVRITVSGTGRRKPDLDDLDLDAEQPMVIFWPDGTTSALTIATGGVDRRSTDMNDAETNWSLKAVGSLDSGAAVL